MRSSRVPLVDSVATPVTYPSEGPRHWMYRRPTSVGPLGRHLRVHLRTYTRDTYPTGTEGGSVTLVERCLRGIGIRRQWRWFTGDCVNIQKNQKIRLAYISCLKTLMRGERGVDLVRYSTRFKFLCCKKVRSIVFEPRLESFLTKESRLYRVVFPFTGSFCYTVSEDW